MRRSVVRGAACGVAALGVALLAPSASASNGLESPDAGAYQVGRGGAWLARADDPLAAYFNPAGLARQASGVHLGASLMFKERCYARTGQESDEDLPTYGQYGSPVSPGGRFAGPGADPEGPEVGPPAVTCAKTTPFPNPQIAGTFRVHERVAIGLAVLGPHAVGTIEWPDELPFVNRVGADATQPAPQRYMLVKTSSFIVFPTLSAAFAITPELSVGAGFTWGVAFAEFENFSESLSPPPSKSNNCGPNGDRPCVATDDFKRDVRSKLNATDIFVPGFVVGALWSPSRYVDLAGWFRWSDAIDTEASVSTESNYWENTGKKAAGEKCSDPNKQECTVTLGEKEGDPGYKAGTLKLNIPMEAKLGVRFHWPRQSPGPRPKWAQGGKTVRDAMSEDLFDVEADFTYANNSAVQNIEVRFKPGIPINGTPGNLPENADIPHHWRDVFGVRVGGEYVVLPSLLSLRAGGFYESNGQDPRYLNIDFHLSEKIGLSGGASVRLGPVDVTVAYQHTFFGTTDNGGRGALYGLSGDASTGDDPNKPGGAFRTYQAINGGQLKSELNEVALGGTVRF
jgi:long-chain fatty acid transport protein